MEVVALSKSEEIRYACVDYLCKSEKCKGKGSMIGGCCPLPKGSIVQLICHRCNNRFEITWSLSAWEGPVEVVQMCPSIPAALFLFTKEDKGNTRRFVDLCIDIYDESRYDKKDK